jgi:hypothetical protein
MAKKKVIDLDTYNQLDAWAISLHEMYRALRRAGFAVDVSLYLISEKDAYPELDPASIPDPSGSHTLRGRRRGLDYEEDSYSVRAFNARSTIE